MKFLRVSFLFLLGLFGLTLTSCQSEDLNFGKEVLKLESQLDALTQLEKGTVDVAVIDSVMAGYYETTGDLKGKIAIVENLVLASEEYGIAGRKEDKALVSKINEALIALKSTKYQEVADKYGLEASLAISSQTTNPLANATDDSFDKIKTAKKLVIGYTVFAPIAYFEGETFTGFDIDLAKEVVAYINDQYDAEIEVEFKEINWSAKEALLANGTIDLIWNGMTITEERSAAMCISIPYLYNKQVAVIKVADKATYTTLDSMTDAIIGVETGSAGESVVVKAKAE